MYLSTEFFNFVHNNKKIFVLLYNIYITKNFRKEDGMSTETFTLTHILITKDPDCPAKNFVLSKKFSHEALRFKSDKGRIIDIGPKGILDIFEGKFKDIKSLSENISPIYPYEFGYIFEDIEFYFDGAHEYVENFPKIDKDNYIEVRTPEYAGYSIYYPIKNKKTSVTALRCAEHFVSEKIFPDFNFGDLFFMKLSEEAEPVYYIDCIDEDNIAAIEEVCKKARIKTSIVDNVDMHLTFPENFEYGNTFEVLDFKEYNKTGIISAIDGNGVEYDMYDYGKYYMSAVSGTFSRSNFDPSTHCERGFLHYFDGYDFFVHFIGKFCSGFACDYRFSRLQLDKFFENIPIFEELCEKKNVRLIDRQIRNKFFYNIVAPYEVDDIGYSEAELLGELKKALVREFNSENFIRTSMHFFTQDNKIFIRFVAELDFSSEEKPKFYW